MSRTGGDPEIVLRGVVAEGHEVASGRRGDARFPGGTIRMQIPHFRRLGLDLGDWHPATINVSIAPHTYAVLRPDYLFENVAWHPVEPAESFSFVRCAFALEEEREQNAPISPSHGGWLYVPHPETKPEHFQAPGTMEILLRERIEGVRIGGAVVLRFADGTIEAD